MGWNEAERAGLVALLRARPDKLTWSQITAEVADAGSAQAVWDRHMPARLFGDGADETESIRAQAVVDVERWRRAPYRFLTFLDPDYPPRLRDVHQMPPVLFSRGTLVDGDVGVSVVGSRHPSAAGSRFAADVAGRLVDRGLTVISGLAAGIDTAAHRAALDAGGRTVAVVGTGITRCFPESNGALQEEIATQGLIISQFWPDAPPTKQSFPMRNATMSAYGYATVVVEAGENSGTRIQARFAVEHGRPVILSSAVATGTNWGRALIGAPGVQVAKDPAEVASLVQDLLDRAERVDRLLALGT